MSYDTSKDYLNSVITLAFHSKELGRIDTEFTKQSEEVKYY